MNGQIKPPQPNEVWAHKKRIVVALIQFVSVNEMVAYRIKGAKRIYYSRLENFLKNWKRQE